MSHSQVSLQAWLTGDRGGRSLDRVSSRAALFRAVIAQPQGGADVRPTLWNELLGHILDVLDGNPTP